MGIFREFIRGIKDDPWIPLASRKASEKKSEAPRQEKLEKKTKSFCDPGSSKPCVTVCAPKPGCSCDCDAIRKKLNEEISQRKLNIAVGKAKMGCSGTCENGPFIGFPQKGYFYLKVKPENISEIVEETLMKGRIIYPLLSLNPDRSFRSDVYYERDTGFLGVIDESISIPEVAKYFLEFQEGVTCGKCIPCRIGITRTYESMQRIVAGEGTTEDLEQVKVLCETMAETPHCDYAGAASRPVRSAVTYFEDEFKAVVKEVPPPEAKAKGAGAEKKKTRDERIEPSEQRAAETAAPAPQEVVKEKAVAKAVAEAAETAVVEADLTARVTGAEPSQPGMSPAEEIKEEPARAEPEAPPVAKEAVTAQEAAEAAPVEEAKAEAVPVEVPPAAEPKEERAEAEAKAPVVAKEEVTAPEAAEAAPVEEAKAEAVPVKVPPLEEPKEEPAKAETKPAEAPVPVEVPAVPAEEVVKEEKPAAKPKAKKPAKPAAKKKGRPAKAKAEKDKAAGKKKKKSSTGGKGKK